MIEDERGPASIADDIKMQSGMPAREIFIGEWIAAVIVIIVVLILIWWMT